MKSFSFSLVFKVDFVSLEKALKEKMGERKVEEKIAEKQKKFSGLLTREGALKLLALEEQMAFRDNPKKELLKLSQIPLLEGQAFSGIVRVKQVFCASTFDKDGKAGKVTRVAVGDDSGEGTLVLWNKDSDFAERKVERNSIISVEGGEVKNGEIHASLFTDLSLLENPPEGTTLPDFSKKHVLLGEAKDGDDFYCRISQKGSVREFEKQNGNGVMKKGKVLNLVVEDGSSPKTLVCWNRNAEIASFLTEGDVLKAEGIAVKNGELQASWNTHLITHAKNHSLKELEFKPFLALGSGEQGFVQIILQKLFDAKTSRKCVSCGSQVEEGKEKCNCGGDVRIVFFVTAQASDALDEAQSVRCVFFGEQAEELLGMKKTFVSPETVFYLKRDFLEGKKLKLKVLAKQRNDGGLELVVRQIRSH